eukprot:182442_1
MVNQIVNYQHILIIKHQIQFDHILHTPCCPPGTNDKRERRFNGKRKRVHKQAPQNDNYDSMEKENINKLHRMIIMYNRTITILQSHNNNPNSYQQNPTSYQNPNTYQQHSNSYQQNSNTYQQYPTSYQNPNTYQQHS